MTTNPRTHKPRATVKTVYLLPGRIDGISPQADGDRALTRGFRPAEISPNDPPCLLIQANELLRSAAPRRAKVRPDVRLARPRTQKTAGSMALLPASLVMKLRRRKPRVKARSSSAYGLIPSIRSDSKYTNLSSALR